MGLLLLRSPRRSTWHSGQSGSLGGPAEACDSLQRTIMGDDNGAVRHLGTRRELLLRVFEGGTIMKRITFLLIAVTTLAGAVAFMASTSRNAFAQEAAPIFVKEIPPGYRDWKVVSVAHEAGELNDIRAILGNDIAIKAYREGKL